MKQIYLRRIPFFISAICIAFLTLSLAGSLFAQPDEVPKTSANPIDEPLTNEDGLLQPVTANRALQFNGFNQYVTFGPAPHLGAETFTLELWFKWDGGGVTVNSGVDGVVAYPLLTKGRGEGDNSSTDPSASLRTGMNYFLGIRSSDQVLVADAEFFGTSLEEGAGDVTPGQNQPISGVTQVVPGEWNHAAATYDGRQWRLFLNGKMESEIVVDQPIRSDSIQHAALATALNSKGVPAGYFAGAIDEVRIWDKALSEQEIRANINAELSEPQPHLLARWGLDEEAGAVIVDSAGQSVADTAVSNSKTSVPGAPFNIVINDAPTAPLLVQPGDTAVGVSTSPTLEVTVTDPEADNMTVTFYGRPQSSSNADFTLIALPDTQKYAASSSRNGIFYAQTQWVVSNKDALNIAHVMQLGDCVDDGGDTDQWDVADTAFKYLEDPATTSLTDGIPYSIAVGNHDQTPFGDPDGASTALYNQYFGSARFSGRNYYGGYYGSNFDNHFELFSAGGMDFIIVSLEYAGATSDVLNWVNALLNSYSSRRAIIVTHHFINKGDPASWGGQGEDIYDALKERPNLFLMHGGHVSGEGQRVDTFNGNTVHTLLADYQSRTNGGDGWLRIMEFSPNNDEIRVKTYSPTLDQYETDSDSQFTFAYDMPGALNFQEIGQVSGVSSGTNASVTWSGLDNLTDYEWYVTVDDGSGTTTGPTYSFTTEELQAPPAVAFDGSPTSGPAPLSVNFTDQTTGIYQTCSWDFGDGSSSTVCNPPDHTYNTSGTYTVTLSVDGSWGPDSLTKTNYIQVGVPAAADFSGSPTTGIAPQEVTFVNDSSGDYTSCQWTFGDGGSSSSCEPKHTYTRAGQFPISLTVNGIGGESTKTKANYITIYEASTADFSAQPTTGPASLLVQFTNLSSGDYDSCTWNFGDGGSSADCLDPSHEYADPGSYHVSLAVSGPGGEATKVKSNYVVAAAPVTADFIGGPTVGITPLRVNFTNLAAGDYDSCLWEFGDNSSSSDCANPEHVYTEAGNYTVSLTVSGAGGSQTVAKADYITSNEAGNANFSANPKQGVAPLAVNFSNLSAGDFNSCLWNFGDGNTLQSCADPTHTYTTPGTYTVSLAIDGPGGPDSVTFNNLITVHEPVAADFDANPRVGMVPFVVNFNNLSSGDYLTCSWDFGDGETSSDCDNPSHTYGSPGSYTVELSVNGRSGSDTTQKIDYISVALHLIHLPLILHN
jgi:PKD repeat protein